MQSYRSETAPPPGTSLGELLKEHIGSGEDRLAAMTKSELIEIITAKQKHLPAKDVELALKQILEIMSDALSQGERIEIRGFGSFSLHFRPPRQGRNPKTGEAVALSGKHVPHFKPGKDLRERVNDGADRPDPRLTRGAR